jgi:hypothetical protein
VASVSRICHKRGRLDVSGYQDEEANMSIGPSTTRLAISSLAFLAASALTLLPAGAAAQAVTGIVRDAETGRPVDGVEVMLINPAGVAAATTMTDDAGSFLLRAPGAGSWILAARRPGYGAVTSEAIRMEASEWLVAEVVLGVEPLQLEPIVVTSRRSIHSPAVERFYERRDRAGRTGLGYFVVREEIERLSPQQPSDLLRDARGVRIRTARGGRGAGIRMAGGCVPAIYLDGVPINRSYRTDSLDDFVTVMDIEGIEVYRGASTQVGHIYDPSGCGLVLVWTRGGRQDVEPTRGGWTRMIGTVAALGLVLLIMR